MRLHYRYLLVSLLTLSAGVAASAATGRPALYNYFDQAGPKEEAILQATYGPRYSVVSATKTTGLTPPKLVQQTYPLYGRIPGGSGTTAVAFIVNPSGRVKDPVVVYSTQPRNDRMVREMVSKWIYEPAKLNGSPVPAIQTYAFGLGRATRSVGYSRPAKKKEGAK
jgi:TonB family protein